MKKIVRNLVVLAALMLLTVSFSQAQIVVRIRPNRPAPVRAFVRPPRPSPGHVWVDEDWVANGNGYAWHGGYWAAPPRAGMAWIPGHWRNTRRGDVWIPGHWR